MITVLADKDLYRITDFIPPSVDLSLYDSGSLDNIPEGTDALLLRTVTKCTPTQFPSLPKSLSFVGTASAGTDHVDKKFLYENDITFKNSAGCNARSVAEYIAVSLLLWADNYNHKLQNYSVGIIGAGHTGSAVQAILAPFDVQTVTYDPPKEKREESFSSASLDDVLACDILTFHTPLTRQNESEHPTLHWLNKEKLQGQKFALIINAARGGIIDEQALIEAHNNKRVSSYILDVWEDEPNFSDATARRAFIKTPHIAGYSIQAKECATKMMINAMIDHFSLKHDNLVTDVSNQPVEDSPSTFWSLSDALTYYHPIEDYKTRLMMLIGRSKNEKCEGFNAIRTGHPLRNELHCLPVAQGIKEKFPVLKKLFN